MSNYECPYCGSELVYDDYFYTGPYSERKKLGDIYKCPASEAGNHEQCEECSLDTCEETCKYKSDEVKSECESCEQGHCDTCKWYCESATFGGHYYNYSGNGDEELREGRPC